MRAISMKQISLGMLLAAGVFSHGLATAETINQSLCVRSLNKTMSDGQAQMVLDLVVALTLAGDERGVDRVRRDYGMGMETTPLRDAFRLIASPQALGVIDYRSVATRVADAEQFQAFLAAYRQRVKNDGLSSVN